MDEMEIVRRIYHMFYLMRKEGVGVPEHAMQQHGMRNRDVMILDAIQQGGNMMKMSDISAYFNVTPAAVSQMMRSLENNKMIERVILDNDRRSVYIKVSEDGVKQIERHEKHITEKIVEIIEILGEEDAEALVRILDKCRVYFNTKKKEQCNQEGDHTC